MEYTDEYVIGLHDEITWLSDRLKGRSRKITEQIERLQDRDKRIRYLEDARGSLAGRVGRLNDQIRELKENRAAPPTQSDLDYIERLKVLIAEREATVEQRDDQIKFLKASQRVFIPDMTPELRGQVLDLKTELDAALAEVVRLEGTPDQAKKIVKQRKEIKRMTRQYKEQRAEIEQLEHFIRANQPTQHFPAQYTSGGWYSKTYIEGLEKQRDELKEVTKCKDCKIEDLKEENDSLDIALSNKELFIRQLKADHTRHTDQIVKDAGIIRVLTDRVAERDQTISFLGDQNIQLNKRNKALYADGPPLRTEVSYLKDMREQQAVKIDRQRAEIESLGSMVNALGGRITLERIADFLALITPIPPSTALEILTNISECAKRGDSLKPYTERLEQPKHVCPCEHCVGRYYQVKS